MSISEPLCGDSLFRVHLPKGILRRPAALQLALCMFYIHVYASHGFACTVCHTEKGEQVRSAIFGADFLFHLTVTVIPFVLFLVLTALIYFGFPLGWIASKVAEGDVS
jgi:hypothetical protein